MWRTRTRQTDKTGSSLEVTDGNGDSWPSGVLCTVHPAIHPSIHPPPSSKQAIPFHTTRSLTWGCCPAAAALPCHPILPIIHRRPSRACATPPPLLPTPTNLDESGSTVRRALTRNIHPVGNTKALSIEPGIDTVATTAGNNQQDVPPPAAEFASCTKCLLCPMES